eukprot:198139_1
MSLSSKHPDINQILDSKQLAHLDILQNQGTNADDVYTECLKYIVEKYEAIIQLSISATVTTGLDFQIPGLLNTSILFDTMKVHPCTEKFIAERRILFKLRNFFFNEFKMDSASNKYISRLANIWRHYDDYQSLIKLLPPDPSGLPQNHIINYIGSMEDFSYNDDDGTIVADIFKTCTFIVENKCQHSNTTITWFYNDMCKYLKATRSTLKHWKKHSAKSNFNKKNSDKTKYLSMEHTQHLMQIYLTKKCIGYFMIFAADRIEINKQTNLKKTKQLGIELWNCKYPRNIDPEIKENQDVFIWTNFMTAQVNMLIEKKYNAARSFYFLASCSNVLYEKLLALKYLCKNCGINGEYMLGKKILKCVYKLCDDHFLPTFRNIEYKELKRTFNHEIRNLKCEYVNCDSYAVALKLNACKGCMKVVYCSRMCQKSDWKLFHKSNCDRYWAEKYHDLKRIYLHIL